MLKQLLAIITLPAIILCGCAAQNINSSYSEEEDAMVTLMEFEDGSTIAGSVFEGQMYLEVTGYDHDKEIIEPLSVRFDTPIGSFATEEITVPLDGNPCLLGWADKSWNSAVIVQFPVYADMTTHDGSSYGSPYTVLEDELYKDSATVLIDLSKYDVVSIDRNYLSELLISRIFLWKSLQYNAQQDLPYRETEADKLRAEHTIARSSLCISLLQEIEGRLNQDDTDLSNDQLLQYYKEICHAFRMPLEQSEQSG